MSTVSSALPPVITSWPQHWLQGGGEMGDRIRAFDWSTTPLGPIEQWPQSLRTSVNSSLDCAFPIVVWWGADLVILYNDEYRTILGAEKHPSALGVAGAKVWSEIWHVIGPMLGQVMSTGEATRSRDLLLHIDRGYLEEAYFSFSYSPIRDERGDVAGIFCPVIETTEKVIGERRLRTLRDLAAASQGVATEQDVFESAAGVLAANLRDVPFSLIYRIDPEQQVATLVTSSGIQRGHSSAPSTVSLDPDLGAGIWALGDVARSGKPAVVHDTPEFAGAPSGAWASRPQRAVVRPILLPGHDRPHAVLVAAVSPMRALDEDYQTFLGLVANQIASGLADAKALEAERQRAAALAELDRAKTAFFSNVSHEFRTPLTLMLGPIEDELAANPAAAPRLELALRSSRRLLKLVNTLLDFSRIEADRIAASYEPTDLTALTADLASVFRSAVEKAGLRFVVDCHALPADVHVDREMWEKIVLNLLSNAFKFTFAGEIAVELRWRGDHVELSVRDSGTGIPAADLPRMFERFYRVNQARSRTHEGTGIGLALVRELTRLHGGDVSVRSVEGEGSTFTVTIRTGTEHLPADRIRAPRELSSTALGASAYVEEALRWVPETDGHPAIGDAMTGDSAPAEPRAVAPSTARVLLVDDNADMREYLHGLLAPYYEVTTCVDGQDALERARVEAVDLVLSDVMMPRIDGFEMLAAIRADEQIRHLPVVLVSARAGEEARMEGLAAGADAYLVKPFTARELLGTVASQLQLAAIRREHERSVRWRAEQFETLVNRAPLGVYLIDGDFRVAQVNPVAAPVFARIPGGVIGRDLDDVMHALLVQPRADEVVRIFRRTLETGECYITPEPRELHIEGGVTEYYEWRLDRITLPDGRFGLVCYFRDVSAHVRARKSLQDADRRKDEFLAVLAHELRNPLAAVRNVVEIVRRSDVGASTRARTEVISRQVDQMVRLIDDLLNVSRISRGLIELRKSPVDLVSVVMQAIEAARPELEAAGLELTLQLPSAPIVLEADAARLLQTIGNLLNNAAKFTRAPGRVWVTADRCDGQAVITVRDSGIGIDPARLVEVFEMFVQVDTSLERTRSGLGLGLTIVKSLVEMHGGSVHASSDGLGHGAEFTIRLPAPRHQVQPSDVDRPELAPLMAEHPRRVLVIEDNHDSAETLAALLTLIGHEVRTAHDGVQGVETVEAFRPDIVLLDIGLPRLNGFDAARRIRALEMGYRVPIVALTGLGQETDRRRSAESGFDAHLVKPIDPHQLSRMLGDLTTNKSSHSV